jgi:hypothetical protein
LQGARGGCKRTRYACCGCVSKRRVRNLLRASERESRAKSVHPRVEKHQERTRLEGYRAVFSLQAGLRAASTLSECPPSCTSACSKNGASSFPVAKVEATHLLAQLWLASCFPMHLPPCLPSSTPTVFPLSCRARSPTLQDCAPHQSVSTGLPACPSSHTT